MADERKPKIGDGVLYVVQEYDVDVLAELAIEEFKKDMKRGTVNPYKVGDLIPGVVVRVWGGTCVNLKLFLYGSCDWWKTSQNRITETSIGGTWKYEGEA